MYKKIISAICLSIVLTLGNSVFADSQDIVVEKTVLNLDIPSDNTMPWAYIEGSVNNHVYGYPVIIQIYQNSVPIHFAQVDMNDDQTYQYKLRVYDSNQKILNIFEGSYTVYVFKVVHPDSMYKI